mmetsp:Transcript_16645/g.39059  ORF Transcript_16645/g.39059 Transcript_16645/m.39059 type:complete len:160 (+) Transcript_16645:72-551(+)
MVEALDVNWMAAYFLVDVDGIMTEVDRPAECADCVAAAMGVMALLVLLLNKGEYTVAGVAALFAVGFLAFLRYSLPLEASSARLLPAAPAGDCAICLGPLAAAPVAEEHGSPARVLRLPCSHDFHEACVTRWICTQRTCPLCRGAVNRIVNRPMFHFSK